MNVASLASLSSIYQSTGAGSANGTSLSALASAIAGSTNAAETTTVTQLADGSSVATVRVATGAVIGVTTTPASSNSNASSASYAIDVTA
jgi:hypothetical protein